MNTILRTSSLIILLTITINLFCQTNAQYDAFIQNADSLYKAKEYKKSAIEYSNAFKSLDWKGELGDRYNAACSWALANYPDSAFYQLNKIIFLWDFSDYDQVNNDTDFTSLYADERWGKLLQKIKSNKDTIEQYYNRPLIAELDKIFNDDQFYRSMINNFQKSYGFDSPEMLSLWQTINSTDSFNLDKTIAIIDKYGWLGKEVVGEKGNATLFLVIQHADLKTQEKYLPIIKKAVEEKKVNASDLALLTDRIEMQNNRLQIYGSQLQSINEKNILYPILDEKNVNKRRAIVGLPPLEEYLKYWGINYVLPTN